MSDLKKFNDKVIAQYSKTITNSVFLMIQNDKALMKEYLKLVNLHNVHTVNKTLGRKIKDSFNLSNTTRENKPTSTLIQSHQKF